MYSHSLQGVSNYSNNLLIDEYDVRCCIRDCHICKQLLYWYVGALLNALRLYSYLLAL